MELEHAFMQSNFFTLFQMLFLGSLIVPGMLGRKDLYGEAARIAANAVVTTGPVALLLYVLFEVSHLN